MIELPRGMRSPGSSYRAATTRQTSSSQGLIFLPNCCALPPFRHCALRLDLCVAVPPPSTTRATAAGPDPPPPPALIRRRAEQEPASAADDCLSTAALPSDV